jgi:hypothetical protein
MKPSPSTNVTEIMRLVTFCSKREMEMSAPFLGALISMVSLFYSNVRMNAAICQICSLVRKFFHGGMDVPGLPSATRQNR